MENIPEQTRIDISNLRFYAQLFEEHKWETPQICWNVFPHTLNAIAERIAKAESELRECDERLQIEQNLREGAEERAKEHAAKLATLKAENARLQEEANLCDKNHDAAKSERDRLEYENEVQRAAIQARCAELERRAAAAGNPVDDLKQWRRNWSHKPTPIPLDATGLWYSEECVDQMLVDLLASRSQEPKP